MIDSATFKALLKKHFDPVMRKHGFKGSGFKYRRITEDQYTHALIIQPNRYGGSCCVELGVHLNFLQNSCNERISAQKVTPYDCEFRRRLAPLGEDCWWEYGNTEEEAIRSITHIVKTLENVGLTYFNLFTNFPSPLINVSITDIEADSPLLKRLSAPSKLRTALTLCRLHSFLGNTEKATEFAEWGLKNISKATLLKPMFEKLK